jgi:hypothetical protein
MSLKGHGFDRAAVCETAQLIRAAGFVKGTALAVPPEATTDAGFSPWREVRSNKIRHGKLVTRVIWYRLSGHDKQYKGRSVWSSSHQ